MASTAHVLGTTKHERSRAADGSLTVRGSCFKQITRRLSSGLASREVEDVAWLSRPCRAQRPSDSYPVAVPALDEDGGRDRTSQAAAEYESWTAATVPGMAFGRCSRQAATAPDTEAVASLPLITLLLEPQCGGGPHRLVAALLLVDEPRLMTT